MQPVYPMFVAIMPLRQLIPVVEILSLLIVVVALVTHHAPALVCVTITGKKLLHSREEESWYKKTPAWVFFIGLLPKREVSGTLGTQLRKSDVSPAFCFTERPGETTFPKDATFLLLGIYCFNTCRRLGKLGS
jgi:hypothetical protein